MSEKKPTLQKQGSKNKKFLFRPKQHTQENRPCIDKQLANVHEQTHAKSTKVYQKDRPIQRCRADQPKAVILLKGNENITHQFNGMVYFKSINTTAMTKILLIKILNGMLERCILLRRLFTRDIHFMYSFCEMAFNNNISYLPYRPTHHTLKGKNA